MSHISGQVLSLQFQIYSSWQVDRKQHYFNKTQSKCFQNTHPHPDTLQEHSLKASALPTLWVHEGRKLSPRMVQQLNPDHPARRLKHKPLDCSPTRISSAKGKVTVGNPQVPIWTLFWHHMINPELLHWVSLTWISPAGMFGLTQALFKILSKLFACLFICF